MGTHAKAYFSYGIVLSVGDSDYLDEAGDLLYDKLKELELGLEMDTIEHSDPRQR